MLLIHYPKCFTKYCTDGIELFNHMFLKTPTMFNIFENTFFSVNISVHFWRKKYCLLRKFARFACFVTYKRVVKGFRQLSVKPCSVNFLTMHHHDDSVSKKLRFRANMHIKTYRCVFKFLRTQKRFQMSPFPKTKSSVFDRCSVVAR